MATNVSPARPKIYLWGILAWQRGKRREKVINCYRNLERYEENLFRAIPD